MKINALIGAASAALMMASSANAADYLIGTNNGQNSGLASEVAEAGGTLRQVFSFGLAIASSDDPAFADNLYNISNIQFVAEDTGFDVDYGQRFTADQFGSPPNSGDDDIFLDWQWGHNYVGAIEAWNNGVRGAGVTVAVLDGGFDVDHPDLAPNVIATADMTGQGIAYCPSNPADPFSHGNHVAGTIAAPDNGLGAIGVAPEASLMLVKVLDDVPSGTGCTGSGSFANVILGIVHATDNGADVINMSLGTSIARQGEGGGNADISALQNAVNKAITYAHQNGTTVIVSAGNDASDLDGGDQGAVRFNTGMSHAVGISALAPSAYYLNTNQDLELASYSNYGTSMVDFGAPGGDFDYPGDELCQVGVLAARPCWVLDFVFSVGNGTWYWSVGTSMSSPHAAGVAALIISETGDSRPAQVIREMRRRAVDNGKPGRDDENGHGIAHSGH